jgi:hypothetical protein
MDFINQIKQLGDEVAKMRDNIQTEEATKNALLYLLSSARIMMYAIR